MELIHEKFGTIRVEQASDGAPLFCAADVCRVLDYKNPSNIIRKLCREKGISKRYTLTEGGNQEMIFIDEGNLYRLILRSNMPQARAFEDWVCDEVLPSLRRTGRYEMRRSYANDEPPLQYIYNVLCARVNWMVDIGAITWPYYNKLSQTGRIWRVRRGGPGQYAMVALISLPPDMRTKVLAEAAGYFGQQPAELMDVELIREPARLL